LKSASKTKIKGRTRSLESRILLAFTLSVSPALVFIIISSLAEYSWLLILTIVPIVLLSVLGGLLYIRRLLQNQFFGVANIIEGLRQGDFTMRPNASQTEGAWGEVNQELSQLAQQLHHERVETIESDIILDKLTEEFDVPLLMTDRSGALKHINRAGLSLFDMDRHVLIGLSAMQLKISPLLEVESGLVIEHAFPAKEGRWEVRRSVIHQHGIRFDVLLLNDLSRALREEERQAWQKLIRVLGHELNNSLASITSVAETMSNHEMVAGDRVLEKGLRVITERSHGLQRFTEAYTSLAKLPAPNKSHIKMAGLLTRVLGLFDESVSLKVGVEIKLNIDSDQIEQVLINIVKNGLESGNSKPRVSIEAYREGAHIVIAVSDNGHGIANQDNLFVPFYTTKTEGSGIGLYLCRQIIEAHQGKIQLMNRRESKGCVVKLWLPV
jgi:nitrogen fixation/metabolism regulation signal transduction histidine kinase